MSGGVRALGLAAFLALAACAGDPAAPSAAGGAPQSAALAAPVRVPKAPELMGLRPEAVRALFGEPAMLRKEGEAEMWQYRTGECVLFLFLYPDPAGAYAVTHVQGTAIRAAARLTPEEATASCLGAVARARAAERATS